MKFPENGTVFVSNVSVLKQFCVLVAQGYLFRHSGRGYSGAAVCLSRQGDVIVRCVQGVHIGLQGISKTVQRIQTDAACGVQFQVLA